MFGDGFSVADVVLPVGAVSKPCKVASKASAAPLAATVSFTGRFLAAFLFSRYFFTISSRSASLMCSINTPCGRTSASTCNWALLFKKPSSMSMDSKMMSLSSAGAWYWFLRDSSLANKPLLLTFLAGSAAVSSAESSLFSVAVLTGVRVSSLASAAKRSKMSSRAAVSEAAGAVVSLL